MKVKHANSVTQNPKEILKKVGKKLARKRKELGYSNSDNFAYDKGINRSQYAKYEVGGPDIRLGTLIRIVNSMGLTLEEFLSDDFEQKK